MNECALATAPATPTRRASRLAPAPTLTLLASIVVSLLAASSAPTPLYALYQAEWDFTPITTTVVFGVYALAVLAALLTLGRLSDHLGRRPVLLTAMAVQVVAMIIFATAAGVPELLAARVVQGLSTGGALGAIGAGMLDVDRARGATANAVAPGMGTATGSLVSGLLVRYLPAPTHLVYVALVAVFALQAAGVLLMPETAPRRPGALAALRPDIRLPDHVRPAMRLATPVLFAVWSLAGLYGSLGPALVRTSLGSTSVVLGGLSLFVLAGTAAVSILLLRGLAARTVMLVGVTALIAGVAVTLVAVNASSPGWFFAGTAIAGVGFGSGFQGGIRIVIPAVAAEERAGVLSLLFVVSYLGMGVPAVIAGVLVVHGGGLLTTAREYGIAVIVLAAVALPGLLRHRTPAL
jgi:MFS family permease